MCDVWGGVHVCGVHVAVCACVQVWGCACIWGVCVSSALPYFQSQYVPGAVCTFLAWILGPAVSQSLNYFFKIGEQY